MAREQLGAAPSRTVDVITKSYVDVVQNGLNWATRITSNRTQPARRSYWGNQPNTSFASLPTTEDTGQAIHYTGSLSPVISGGLLIQTTGSAGGSWYRYWGPDSGPINRLGARFIFSNNSGALTTSNGAICVAMANGSAANLATTTQANVHFTLTPTTWTLGAFSGSLTTLASGTFATSLAQDGVTVYEVEIYRVGNTVTMVLPDGTIQSYVDSAGYVNGTHSGWSLGNYGFIEQYFNQTTDNIVGFVEYWSDTGTQYPPTDRYATTAQVATMPQVLQNKTISGLVNTLTNIPADQVVPTANNLVTVNSSFIGSLTGWTISGGTWAWDGTTSADSIGGSAKCTGTSTSSLLLSASPLSVSAAQVLGLACQTKWSSVTGTDAVQIYLLFYNSGTYVGTGTLNGTQSSWQIVTASSAALTTTGWVRLAGTVQVPAGVNQIYVVASVGAGITGGSVWLDAFTMFTPAIPAGAIVTGGNGVTAYGANYQTLDAYLDALPVAAQKFYNKDLTGSGNTFPTFNQNTTGTAAKLTTARTVQTNLASTSTASFDGSANIAPGVTGTLPVGNGGTGQTSLTSLSLTTPTVTGYTETVQPLGTVGSTKTIPALSGGTMMTCTLTSGTPCTFTMPTAASGLSFILVVEQPASGTATTATFTGVKWPSAGAPVITGTLGKADALTFFCPDGSNWWGSYVQGYTY